jgi:hypothetical protein
MGWLFPLGHSASPAGILLDFAILKLSHCSRYRLVFGVIDSLISCGHPINRRDQSVEHLIVDHDGATLNAAQPSLAALHLDRDTVL